MKLTERELERAQVDAAQARARLTSTMVELQARLKPSALMAEAVDTLREKAEDYGRQGVDLVKARPVASAGVVAAVLIWLFRGTLWDSLVAAFSRNEATAPVAQEFQPGKQRASRTRRHGG